MSTLRPLSNPDPVTRLRSINGPDRFRSSPAALPAATRHAPAPPFERELRAALARLRESIARVEVERDPLTRHLGFRALNCEVGTLSLNPEHLQRDDDRDYARTLLQSVAGRETQSFVALDAAARLDLEILLQVEVRLADRAAAAHVSHDAIESQTAARATVERLEREAQRAREKLEHVNRTSRPLWLRVCGVILAVAGVSLAAALLAMPRVLEAWFEGLPPLRWSTALGALALGSLGGWLAMSPQQRRAWVQRSVDKLVASTRAASARTAQANEALTRARKLFEAVDAECRREEAAALAVLQRRPGVQRYVNLGGPVVVFDVT